MKQVPGVTILQEHPPNIDQIAEKYPGARRNDVVFAYGEIIYVPSGIPLGQDILAHELVHCIRQLEHPGGVDGWWADYLSDPEFCYIEELLAHRAEYQQLCKDNPARHLRLQCLKHVAKKLSSALYGKMVTFTQAKKALKKDTI